MSKERLAAFSDAVLAIIMTILVLELDMPKGADMQALLELKKSFFSYALSFFWLGVMWVNLHNSWHHKEKISRSVLWWNIVLLFFSSMVPYSTKYVDIYFMSSTAQAFYGIIVLLVTIANIGLDIALEQANEGEAHEHSLVIRKWLVIDVAIKVAGIILGILWFPPMVMISVIITMIIILIVSHAPLGN